MIVFVGKVILSARKKLWEVKELSAIMKSVADVNIKTISTDNLKGFIRVGICSLVSMKRSLAEAIETPSGTGR